MRHGAARWRCAALILSFLLGVSLLSEASDEWLRRPVDDATYRTYLDFFAYDRDLPFEVQSGRTEEDQGVQIERLSFQSTQGVRVPAVLFQLSEGRPGERPAVIVLHGGAPMGKDGRDITALGTLLARAGWIALAIDMQYFGERASQLLTTFSEREKHDRLYNQPSVYLAWVIQTVKDVSRAFDLLVDRGADPQRIALHARSRGGIVGSIAAAVERRLAAAVLFYAGHFDALETGHLPAACPANYIGRISPRPVLFVNGERDSDMIKDRAVVPWFNLARRPKEIIWTTGGHGFMTEEHRAAIMQWLRDKLQ